MALNIKDYEVIYNGKLGMGYILPEDVMIENFQKLTTHYYSYLS